MTAFKVIEKKKKRKLGYEANTHQHLLVTLCMNLCASVCICWYILDSKKFFYRQIAHHRKEMGDNKCEQVFTVFGYDDPPGPFLWRSYIHTEQVCIYTLVQCVYNCVHVNIVHKHIHIHTHTHTHIH